MAEPIWKDYFVNLGTPASAGAGVPFYIYCTPKTANIFQGVAYPKPGESTAVVRINDICANYIYHYFLEQSDPSMPAKANFKVYAGTVGYGTQKASVDFYNNWSYDPLYNPATDGQNFPVVLTFAPGQLIPVTLYSGSLGTATIYMENGMTYSCTPTKMRGGDFNNDYNLDFLLEMQYFGDSYVIPMADYPGAVRVVYKGRTWKVSKHCPQYALYYLNAYGGWDALPIEGRTIKSDAITRYTTEQAYDNRQPSARGKTNYLNELKHSYEFHTGWLTAAQGELMHNLLNSPSVFVHDLVTGMVWPLVLTNSTTEYKDRHGILHSYVIEAELAQNRLRR